MSIIKKLLFYTKNSMMFLKKYLWDNIYGAIITLLLIINFGWQSFIIPSSSMEGTMMTGDFVVVNKHEYGFNTPVIPYLEINLLPLKNNHFNKFRDPDRGEVIVFKPPMSSKTYYVKRLVAKGGDSLFFKNKKLYIHFVRLPKNIDFSNIPKLTINGLIFYKEPYKTIHKKIHNTPNIVFKKMPSIEKNESKININDLTPDLKNIIHDYKIIRTVSEFPYKTENKQTITSVNNIKYYIYTVPKNKYFMVGDNRDYSNDSRFWGPIEWKNIIGTPSFVWFSLDWKKYSIRFNRIGLHNF